MTGAHVARLGHVHVLADDQDGRWSPAEALSLHHELQRRLIEGHGANRWEEPSSPPSLGEGRREDVPTDIVLPVSPTRSCALLSAMADQDQPEVALTDPPKRGALEEGPALLLVNSKCRMGPEAFPAARAALYERGIPLLAAHRLSKQKRMDQVLREALESGVRRILIGGGDGTLSSAVAHLLGRDVTLGVLPLGTGNDFARSLGIPPTLEAACDIIAAGYTARVDVGLANGRPFLNAASLGLASAIAKRLTPELKRKVGKLAYPVAAMAELWEHQPFRVRMKTDRGELELEALQLVVGNGRYHGAGNMVTPEATLDDHCLDAYTITAPSSESGREGTGLGHMQDLSTLARVALSLRRGEHVSHPAVTAVRSSRLYVEAEPPQDINADGELIGHTPVRFEVAPGALRVYAPAPTTH